MKSIHLGVTSSRASLWLAVVSSLFLPRISANSCQPYIWDSLSSMRIASVDDPVDISPTEGEPLPVVNPGEINCRFWTNTPEEVDYYTCSRLARRYLMPVDQVFFLKPELDKDCSNIQPQTEYCVEGLRTAPPASATRASVMATISNTAPTERAAAGETAVAQRAGVARLTPSAASSPARVAAVTSGNRTSSQPAGTKWTKGGTCGGTEGMRYLAEWGRCCNVNGICGETPADCYVERGCQDAFGVCASNSTSAVSMSAAVSTSTPPGTMTSGTTASASTSTVAPAPACTGGSNAPGITDNLKGLCSYSCDYNHCPVGACGRTGPAAEPATGIPGCHGCPADNITEDLGYYEDLCKFTCSRGYCPPGACKYFEIGLKYQSNAET
ncbi:hypothetical protein CGRA01v4_04505 [Colletotrichum graminicola]|uniref:Chitin-binding type-1 domain-containing protein n=1 Tax=Colletotrichum graminicola (strain M1.001 / M2 / FGSC 10212) TaxID=645133 RepID=E3Q8Q6_COLGM|nr:uncharacterized protein GLRG_01915 [Colletotrichum graminicola M1.001]EFQ27420.1 hypothetical protein GLRG_01915 [Colletotrichum graminicola M1.001]WDK13224.1 hypothetical protein CGRA01v4_04505 [Colletotrichum graminicola]